MGTILTLGAVGIGGYFLYEWLTTPAAAATTSATPAAPPASSTSTSTSTMTPAKPSLSALATSIQNGAATDPNFSGSPLQGSGIAGKPTQIRAPKHGRCHSGNSSGSRSFAEHDIPDLLGGGRSDAHGGLRTLRVNGTHGLRCKSKWLGG